MTVETLTSIPDPRDLKKYFFEVTVTRRVVTSALQTLFRSFARWQAEGVENLPDCGPVILAANHLTNFDVVFIQFVLPRPIFFMGKEELFRNPLADWAFRQLGAFPVYRGARDQWAMQHAEKVLAHSLVLGMFPEGTRSKGRGLTAARPGIARLAQARHCPIIPLAIDGPQYLFKRNVPPRPIQIRLGAPIYSQPGETQPALTERAMFALASLLPPELRGVYSADPASA